MNKTVGSRHCLLAVQIGCERATKGKPHEVPTRIRGIIEALTFLSYIGAPYNADTRRDMAALIWRALKPWRR